MYLHLKPGERIASRFRLRNAGLLCEWPSLAYLLMIHIIVYFYLFLDALNPGGREVEVGITW